MTEPDIVAAELFMGAHWLPFCDDPAEIIGRLPALLATAELLHGFATCFPAPTPEPDSWCKGVQLAWPDSNCGIAITLRVASEKSELVCLYPFCVDGVETGLRLDRVIVWESGFEAHICATLGSIPLTFFDTHYLINRAWYATGEDYQFILTGIAYDARAFAMDMPFPPSPCHPAWGRPTTERRSETPPQVAFRSGLADIVRFKPVPEWAPDEYSFRGAVTRVKPMPDMLGQSAWLARVTVMCTADETTDTDLEILITGRAWKDTQPLAVGQIIEGRLWLQGRLWRVPDRLRKPH